MGAADAHARSREAHCRPHAASPTLEQVGWPVSRAASQRVSRLPECQPALVWPSPALGLVSAGDAFAGIRLQWKILLCCKRTCKYGRNYDNCWNMAVIDDELLETHTDN
ncbi:hypothetical protein Dimus_021980 [Dionaea muscipula]